MIAVYDILKDGQVVYVGITDNPNVREQRHKTARRIPRRATLVVVDWFKTRRAAMKCEKARIKLLKPVLNIQHGECHADDVDGIVEKMNTKDKPQNLGNSLEQVLADIDVRAKAEGFEIIPRTPEEIARDDREYKALQKRRGGKWPPSRLSKQ